LNGYRLKPVVEQPKPTKIIRAKMLVVSKVAEERTKGKEGHEESSPDAVQIPATSLDVLQRIGLQLGIDPARLTKEQLEADPVNRPKDVQDD
jgi:hypothetical protein